jgi:nicotinamidase-related amidase
MKIPNSNRKKALVIIDVQEGLLNRRNRYIIERIKTLISQYPYSLYIEAAFHAEKNSLWQKQTNWIFPKNGRFTPELSIHTILAHKKTVYVEKQTKSVFKGTPTLLPILKRNTIRELHLVGLDANDCVLGSAYEAFDLGFYTYVLEECTESQDAAKIRDAGFAVLRHVNLTNKSCVETIPYFEVRI